MNAATAHFNHYLAARQAMPTPTAAPSGRATPRHDAQLMQRVGDWLATWSAAAPAQRVGAFDAHGRADLFAQAQAQYLRRNSRIW